MSTPVPDRRRDAVTAMVLGAVAAVISAVASWVPSLWLDEAASLSAADRPWPDLVGLLRRLDAVHGTYYAVLHAWTSIAGDSAFAARLPSAIAVGVAAAGTYVLSRLLVGRWDVSCAAALVFAVLPRVTWMGLEARSFAFATAAAVWMTVVFVWAARGGGPRWWAYVPLVTIGIAFHLYVALLLLAHAIALVWFVPTWRERLRWLAAAVGGVLLASPIVLLALDQRGQLTDTRLGAVGLARRVVVNQWFLGETPQGVPAGPWQAAAILLALLGWLLVVAGAVRLARSTDVEQPVGSAVLLGAWVIVPTVLIAGQSLAGGSLYHPRYFGFCAPALALLLAYGVLGLRRRAVRIAVVAALVVLVIPVYVSQRGVHAKSGYDWSTVAARLDREAGAGDGVYFSPLRPDDATEVRSTMRSIASAYPAAFAPLVDVTRIDGPEQRDRLFAASRQLAASGAALGAVDTVWVVRRADMAAADRQQEDATLADHGFVPVSTWTGPRTSLERFERP